MNLALTTDGCKFGLLRTGSDYLGWVARLDVRGSELVGMQVESVADDQCGLALGCAHW